MSKLKAKKIPYSSIVGGGLVLSFEDGRAGLIINIIGTTNGVTKEQNDALSTQLSKLINDAGGLELP